jgi:hypothetical protein
MHGISRRDFIDANDAARNPALLPAEIESVANPQDPNSGHPVCLCRQRYSWFTTTISPSTVVASRSSRRASMM